MREFTNDDATPLISKMRINYGRSLRISGLVLMLKN